MHGLAVYIMDGHPFAWDLPLESSAFYVIKEYYMFSMCFILFGPFFSINHCLLFVHSFLCYFISNID